MPAAESDLARRSSTSMSAPCRTVLPAQARRAEARSGAGRRLAASGLYWSCCGVRRARWLADPASAQSQSQRCTIW